VSGPAYLKGQAILTDSVPKLKMFIPTMVRVGGDVLGLARTAIDKNRDPWEVQAEIDIHRYFLAAEFGGEVARYTDDDYKYKSEGTYWRFGADINIIPREAFGSVLYFGLRYGKSTFSEELLGTVNDPVWGDLEIESYNDMAVAEWYEIVTGMKAKVWKNLYMGYALRVKASLKIENSAELEIEPFQIPGYGLGTQDFFFGINYYIAWRFQFQKKYMVPKKP
jgi:hypothetical protein